MKTQIIFAFTSFLFVLSVVFSGVAQAETDFSDLPDYSGEVIKHPTCQLEMSESLKTFEMELRLEAKGWVKHQKSEEMRMEVIFAPIQIIAQKPNIIYRVEGKLLAPAETTEKNQEKIFLHVGKDLKSQEGPKEVTTAFILDFIKKLPTCKPVLFPEADN